MNRLKIIYSENKIAVVIIAASTILTLFLLALLGISRLTSHLYYSSWQTQKENLKKEAQKDYNELIIRQEKEKDIYDSNDQKLRKAEGIATIHFIFVRPPHISESKITPLINNLKNSSKSKFTSCVPSCEEIISANFINTFFENEAKKYLTKNFSVDTQFHGPFILNDLTKVGDFANPWGKDEFGMQKLKDEFEKTLLENGISISKDDFVEFLYFDNTLTLEAETDRESFYDYKKFRSFADPEQGRAYINVYSFSPLFSSNLTTIIAHETLHLFGATDKYNEYDDEKICGERGRGDVEKKPPIPQTTGDIMCLYIEKEDDAFEAGSLKDNTLVINSITAKEIGWRERN